MKKVVGWKKFFIEIKLLVKKRLWIKDVFKKFFGETILRERKNLSTKRLCNKKACEKGFFSGKKIPQFHTSGEEEKN